MLIILVIYLEAFSIVSFHYYLKVFTTSFNIGCLICIDTLHELLFRLVCM